MDWQRQTIKTYDDSALTLAGYFKGIGPRTKYIELALRLADKAQGAKVVEIGCGDGRDAAEIIKRVAQYEGFDPSAGMLEIARTTVPSASFVKADALTYTYPAEVDVTYAFASLLHVNKDDLPIVFAKVAQSLRPGGIFYISLKERAHYVEEVKKDEFGERMFYYYNTAHIKGMAAGSFEIVHEDHELRGHTDWLEIALKRK